MPPIPSSTAGRCQASTCSRSLEPTGMASRVRGNISMTSTYLSFVYPSLLIYSGAIGSHLNTTNFDKQDLGGQISVKTLGNIYRIEASVLLDVTYLAHLLFVLYDLSNIFLEERKTKIDQSRLSPPNIATTTHTVDSSIHLHQFICQPQNQHLRLPNGRSDTSLLR